MLGRPWASPSNQSINKCVGVTGRWPVSSPPRFTSVAVRLGQDLGVCVPLLTVRGGVCGSPSKGLFSAL